MDVPACAVGRLDPDGPWIGFRNYELILSHPLFWESVLRTASFTVNARLRRRAFVVAKSWP